MGNIYTSSSQPRAQSQDNLRSFFFFFLLGNFYCSQKKRGREQDSSQLVTAVDGKSTLEGKEGKGKGFALVKVFVEQLFCLAGWRGLQLSSLYVCMQIGVNINE